MICIECDVIKHQPAAFFQLQYLIKPCIKCMMESVWIEDFIALDKTRNFTAAADQRHTTQPAFSRRIQNLEYWIGADLFDRQSRPVALTTAGEEFKKRIYRLREDIIDLKRIVSLSQTYLPQAKVIYTTNTIAIGFLPQWLQDHDIGAYKIVVSSVTQCLEAMRDGRCDIAFIPRFDGVDYAVSLHAKTVLKDRLVFISPSPDSVTMAGGHIHGDVILYSPKTALGQAVAASLKNNGITLASLPVSESASAEAVLAQIRAGLGSGWVVQSLITPGDCFHYPEGIVDIPFEVVMISHSGD